jgi:hypothetical protein
VNPQVITMGEGPGGEGVQGGQPDAAPALREPKSTMDAGAPAQAEGASEEPRA